VGAIAVDYGNLAFSTSFCLFYRLAKQLFPAFVANFFPLYYKINSAAETRDT
jgi:hypothetical protein